MTDEVTGWYYAFRSSDTISELAKALAAAQAEMGAAKKDAVNPHFRSTYANLAAVVDASRPVLVKHGIAIVQSTPCNGPTVLVSTRLIHASGEWIESSLSVQAKDASPQAIGSAITYGRRYGWSTLIGLASEEDDDGETATARWDGIRKDVEAAKTEPSGFGAWHKQLEEAAQKGTDALKKAWLEAPSQYRDHISVTGKDLIDKLKAVAASKAMDPKDRKVVAK